MQRTRALLCVVTLSLMSTLAIADQVRVVSIDLHAQSAILDPGASKYSTVTMHFVEGCEYLNHEIEIIEQLPTSIADGEPNLGETFQRDESGKISRLIVTIGVHRSFSSKNGAASMLAKLSIKISCKDAAFERVQGDLERAGWAID